MKRIEIACAATLAMLAVALIGQTTASADTLCLAHEEPCAAGNSEAIGTKIVAESTYSEFTAGGLEPTECKSWTTVKTTKNLGGHAGLEGLMESLFFDECEGYCTFVTESHAENLPYKVVALGATGQSHLLGSLHVTSDGKGNPSVLLNDCGVFKVDCLYETSSALMVWLSHKPANQSEPLKPALIHVKVPVTRNVIGHAFCPTQGLWEALFAVTEPTGLIGLIALP